MNPERWQRVKRLLEQVIALPDAERSPFLDRECGNDAELRREVDSLLASHDEAGTGFLKSPVISLHKDPPPALSRTGRRVGAFQIVEELGHGGMGEVYRARRADGQFTQEVAVKLVRGGFDSKFVLERFRTERQILATLDHPNIARLLDGGTDEGIPYLVMELIEGERIDLYCDEHKLTITQRLQLFRQVCAAVQYAHQRLVIHRDIKPSNVLVTKDGVPKLLDFGIAKIFDPSAADAGETTIGRPMTPEYASPEQIRGQPITTASDVYSLGVVLYQLLTGRSPYPGETRSTLDLARAVCDTDPGRPSTVVLKPSAANSGQDAPLPPDDVSSCREGSPAKLRRRLEGDLDNIVLKALRKEPPRRYASVEQFAEDIRRHLDGMPVSAVKDSFRYRTGKFIRRNQLGIAAAALVALSLGAGVGATVRQARIARRQAEIASAERARAEKRFKDVRELANSLIFEIHDSIQALPGATPSRKLLLDRAVQYLDKLSQDAAGDPNLERELAWGYQRLANVQGDTTQANLGQVRAADVSNQKATRLFEAVAKADPTNLTDQINLAMAYRWRAFFDIYEKSGRAEIERALAVTEPLMAAHGDNLDLKNERAEEYSVFADNLDAMGDRIKAIEAFRQTLTLRQEILSTNPNYAGIRQRVTKGTVDLGNEMGHFGSRDEALRLLDAGIADFEALLKENPSDPGLIRALSSSAGKRGEVEMMQGNIAAARADFERGRARMERLDKLDPENKTFQSDLWISDFEVGRAIAVTGRYADALPLLERSFQGYLSLHLEADLGPGPAAMQAWIAEAQAGTGRLDEALKNFQKAAASLAEDQANFDDARCDLATVHTKIGRVLARMGKPKEAEAAFQKALDITNLPVSIEHLDIPALFAAADACEGLGDLSLEQARSAPRTARSKLLSDASSWFEKSLEIWKQIPNPSRFSSNGYLVVEPREVSRRLAACKTELAAKPSRPRSESTEVFPAPPH